MQLTLLVWQHELHPVGKKLCRIIMKIMKNNICFKHGTSIGIAKIKCSFDIKNDE